MPAPLVDRAGSWSSDGQGHARGMSRGGCGLRESLGSLLVDGHRPTQFVVWPEVCCLVLEPTGCWVGPGLDAKMSDSRRVLADECSPLCPPPVSPSPGWATATPHLHRRPSKTSR